MTAPLTGTKVLIIVVSAFALIIGVNLVMAWQAISTFPGLEVANSYVASQDFDADRAAQEALGWNVTPEYANGIISLIVRDKAGLPAPIATLEVVIGRTTHVRDDQRPELAYRGGMFTAPVALKPGNWLIHVEAKAKDGTLFRQRLDFFVKG